VAGAARDAVAHARDLTMSARDRDATLRDAESTAHDANRLGEEGTRRRRRLWSRATRHERRAAAERAAGADARARGAQDREHAAEDRARARHDRIEAQADRESAVRQIVISETDTLTGARIRVAGLADLDLEIDRARRTVGLLAVAYVDVVGLKALNDAHGHTAGDQLLQRCLLAIRRHLRTYDLVARLGGDEFLCVMSGATVEDARQRFHAIQFDLGRMPERSEIKVGFAALAPEDIAADLIARADADLPARHVSLTQVLSAVNELGSASVGLTAWELCVDESEIDGAWKEAGDTALLRPAGYDDDGGQLYRLTPAGHERQRQPTPYPQRRRLDQ